MPSETEQIYPDCSAIIRTVPVGGLTKSELLQELQRNAISMNEAGETLVASDQFTTSETRYSVTTVELTVGNLGFSRGATMAEIYTGAGVLGLDLCPLEVGPHLRLQYRDQPEGHWGQPVRHHQAPAGSITVASTPLTDDDDVPKGLYLRRITSVRWLRGYRSGPEHIWAPDDHFIFGQRYKTAVRRMPATPRNHPACGASSDEHRTRAPAQRGRGRLALLYPMRHQPGP